MSEVQHKSQRKKTIILAAVGRPRPDKANNQSFDGKVGLFPLTRQVAGQRNGRHRAAGTIGTRMVEVN